MQGNQQRAASTDSAAEEAWDNIIQRRQKCCYNTDIRPQNEQGSCDCTARAGAGPSGCLLEHRGAERSGAAAPPGTAPGPDKPQICFKKRKRLPFALSFLSTSSCDTDTQPSRARCYMRNKYKMIKMFNFPLPFFFFGRVCYSCAG